MEKTAGMEQVIERLRAEKKNLEKYYYECGNVEGAAFCLSASYVELEYARRHETAREKRESNVHYSHAITESELLGEYFENVIDTIDFISLQDLLEEHPGPVAESWEQGWKDAVVEFWEEVKHQIN